MSPTSLIVAGGFYNVWSVIFSIFGMTTHLKEQRPTPVNLRDERINCIGEIRDKLRIKKEEKFKYKKKNEINGTLTGTSPTTRSWELLSLQSVQV